MPEKKFNLDSYNHKKKNKDNKKNKSNTSNTSNTSNMSNISKPKNNRKTIRVTFILNPETKEKIDAIAYYNRKEKSQQVEDILSEYIKKNYTRDVKEVWKKQQQHKLV